MCVEALLVVWSDLSKIISTTQLVKKGWSVIQSPGETYRYHEDSGTLISDVLLWGGTPWLRACRAAQPSLKDGSQPMELVESSMVEPEGLKVSMVGAVELSSQEKLRQHVLRGHYPFDPHYANTEEEFLEHQGEVCVRESLKFGWISSFWVWLRASSR